MSTNVIVNVEFKVTLHEQVRYRGTLQLAYSFAAFKQAIEQIDFSQFLFGYDN